MALWEKSMRLQQPLLDQMKSLYGPKLPIEVRHYLSAWIESQSWIDVDPSIPAHEMEARRLFDGMMQALQNLMTTNASDFIMSTQLDALYTHMNNEYHNSAMELVRVVQGCLYAEAELVEKQEQLNAPSSFNRQVNTHVTQIQQMLQSIVGKTESIDSMFRGLSTKLENFIIQFGDCSQIDYALRQGNRIPPDQVSKYRERKQLLDQILAKDAEEMKKTCNDLGQRFMDCMEVVRSAQGMVKQELLSWKQSQRMFTWEDDRGRVELNQIQQWFESLAELIWRNRLLSKQFDLMKTRFPQGIIQNDLFSNVQQIITGQLVELIQQSFVLEKQPPQVIKTANRFSATVRLLVGSKLQIHLSAPEVIATIINDKQAKAVLGDISKPIPPNLATGDILNNQKTMEYNIQTGILSCAFNFMQLKKIKRNSDKKASETVTEEKFTLLFRTHFTIGGGEMDIPVRELSLPVVVTVHVTQQPHAEATIFWDNAFAEPNREPFSMPDSVAWQRLSEALNCFFHSNCGRGLTAQQLDYLGRKILGLGPDDDLTQRVVTRQHMLKDQLRSRNFTFWEWFYKHMDLIKSTLKREWIEGSINGFMERADAQKMLMACASGTFLIRFSEGEPGGVSVAWVTDCADMGGNSERQVLSLAPWNKHDISIRPLADRLQDLTNLVYLFPNKPKDDVFGKYYTPTPNSEQGEVPADGYIRAELKAQVPTHIMGRSIMSNPASPNPSIVSMPVGTPSDSVHDWHVSGLNGGIGFYPDLPATLLEESGDPPGF